MLSARRATVPSFVSVYNRDVHSENGFKNAITECIQNDILREYLQRKSREVINLLLAEYDYDIDIAVQREEEREIALKEGIAQGEAKGFSIGIAQGKQEGISEGAYQKAIETAKLMRLHNYPIAEISTMTGLAKEEIESL